MSQIRTASRQAAPEAPIHDRAIDNLQFIRETMERAGSFTAVSGLGIVGMGVIAVPAALIARLQPNPASWMTVWIITAALAAALGIGLTARKARDMGLPMVSGPGRKFAFALTPALAAGAILTWALTPDASQDLVVGVWLLLYGAGVTAGGAMSVPVVPVMGLSFMAIGVVALLLPPDAANGMMVAGFGGLHIVFGSWIARRYGG